MTRKTPAPRSGAGVPRVIAAIMLRLCQLLPEAENHIGAGAAALGREVQAIREAVVCRPADSGVGPATAAGLCPGCPGQESQHLVISHGAADSESGSSDAGGNALLCRP